MNKREYKFLDNKLSELVDNEIISNEQYDKAKEYYGTKIEKKSIVTTLGAIGVLLIALSIITLFAINWKDIPKEIKVIVSFIPIVITSIMLYIYMANEEKRMQIYTSIFAPIGIIATNSLLHQVFHIQADVDGLFFVSLLMFLPIAFILRNYISLIVYGAGTIIYASIAMGNSSAENIVLLKTCLLTLPIIIFNVKNYMRDKRDGRNIAMWIINISLVTMLLFYKEIFRKDVDVIYIYMIYLLTRVLFGKENILNKILSVLFMALLIMACMSSSLVSVASDIEFGIDTLIITIAIIYLIYKSKIYKDYKEIFLMIFVFILGYSKMEEDFLFVFVNIIAIARGIYSIVIGSKDNSHKETRKGIAIILLIILFRFFASDLSFTAKSIMFLIAGAGFMIGANEMKKKAGGKKDEQIDTK